MFKPVRMYKLFTAVIKDHIGKVISALGENESCHFIGKPVPNIDITCKKNILLSIEHYVDGMLLKAPVKKREIPGIGISNDVDIMLHDIAIYVQSHDEITTQQLIEIKKTIFYLKSIYNVLENCNETQYTYLLEAWVPEGKQDIVQASIEDAANCKSIVYFSDPVFGETPPTIISNPQMMKPFEKLVKMYGLPSYYELDPTWVVFVTFPLIFGMMYGDVGHGIIIFLLSMGIFLSGEKRFKKFTGFKDFSPILMGCGVFSVIFGFLYGEFLGFKFHPLWLSPSENISYFLVLSVWIGVLHLIVGFVLNGINLWNNKKYLRAIFQLQWIIFSISSVYFITGFVDIVSPGFGGDIPQIVLILLPVAVMAASAMMINSIEGKGGLSGIMVPFYLGIEYAMHLMSYMRLLIMALAHSTISATIIALSGSSTVSIVVAGIITFVLIIIVETFIVFIQTLRLHWVEWFYLFYRGKGTEFRGFRL
ncbi:MAG: hypothetical protein OIN89_07930 [Candidatus Methanoperedens sp.]|jgi:V/A-type H+-transporting ATPase subunit I|nr:hypothetical protein [Candidatus Methanoperedens sp.]PKL53456.1 MAG: hypothetical protein CVV36_06965 [Candidatus Methanoperedenaceae archaeon HGW-Methanoperedenaceae-1]